MSDITSSSSSAGSSINGDLMPFHFSVHGSQLFRESRGRSFNTRNDKYLLPIDDEEQIRQGLEHKLLSLVMDSLYAAPDLVLRAMAPRQDVGSAILDIGTGSGHWAIDMAKEFSSADVVGMDLVPPSPLPEFIPSNCRFEVDDVNLDLSHYAKSFNVVHIRSVEMGVKNFEDTIHRVAQMLRADGALLLVSSGYRLYAESLVPLPSVSEGDPGWCASQALFTALHAVGRRKGGDINASNSWTTWLKSNPLYTNVGFQDIYVPVGPWMPHMDARCTKIASLVQQNILHFFQSCKVLLIEGGYKQSLIERWITLAEREVLDMHVKMLFRWRYVWASRTRTRWTPNA